MPRVRQQVAIGEVDFEADAERFQWAVVKSECAVGGCFPHSRLRFDLSKFVFNNAIFTTTRFILNNVNCTIYVLFGFTQNKHTVGLQIFDRSFNPSTVTSYSSPDCQEHESFCKKFCYNQFHTCSAKKFIFLKLNSLAI